MKEKTYVMVKPGFADNPQVIKYVKQRLKQAGLTINEESYICYDESHAKQHYVDHVLKSFYPELEQYITSSPAYGMIVSGKNAISTIRAMAGATKNPEEGTIRYEVPKMLNLPIRVTENVVHSSDSVEAAQREIAIFEDLVNNNTKTV